ncbi:MAG: hypothetical protein HZA93_10585 [Verrucomicrobia bacterium]|nr:hypothetical protein [Verrucomicrobiota bacterium]
MPRPLLFSLIYACIAGGAAFVKFGLRRQRIDIFSPVEGLCVLLYFYSIAGALYVEKNGTTLYGDIIDAPTLGKYYQCCIIGLVGIIVGSAIPLRIRATPLINLPEKMVFRRLHILTAIAAVVFFPFYYKCFDVLRPTAYIETALSSRVERMEQATAGIQETMLITIPTVLILMTCSIKVWEEQRRLWRVLYWIPIVLFTLASLLSGLRALMVLGVLGPCIAYHYSLRRLRLWTVMLFGVSVYFFVNTVSLVRSTSNPAEMLSILRNQIADDGLGIYSPAASGELLTSCNLLTQIKGIDAGESSYTLGYSVLTELLMFVPRPLFSARPLPLCEKFIDVFHPGVRETGAGYGFFCIQEGHWAFGIFGVFLFMLAYSSILQGIYDLMKDHLWRRHILIIYPLMYHALVISAVRSGLVCSFKTLALFLVPLCFVYVTFLPMLLHRRDRLFGRNVHQ